ncbi:hypothetical protein T07_13232 [Trichinella nelsoni]|uniref:Uncharacterized protein n=1 Tax=Trichinella nelsoni TaxID=6336 RepID=A0A0V0SHP3_9BILA|nr:hypothetical protein T07_13232 [Trichinella nelsoni]
MDRMVGYCPGQLGSCEMAVGRLLAPTPYGGSSNQCKSGNSALPDISGPVDKSGASVWNRGTGAAHLSLAKSLCCGVEHHKRKQPCTESANPLHTCTLGSKNRIHLFGGFEFYEC